MQNRFPIQHPWRHLGFLIGTILALFYLQGTQILPIKFGVSWHFGSGVEAKNKCLRWKLWWASWISNQNEFSYFDQLVTPLLPIKCQDNRPEEAKNRFSRWRPSWISNRNNFSYFYLQVTPILPTKFYVNWPFGAKYRFSRWRLRRPSWISDRNNFSYF